MAGGSTAADFEQTKVAFISQIGDGQTARLDPIVTSLGKVGGGDYVVPTRSMRS